MTKRELIQFMDELVELASEEKNMRIALYGTAFRIEQTMLQTE